MSNSSQPDELDARAGHGVELSPPLKLTLPLAGFGEAGHDVDERGLAGTVRSDQEAQLALVDREVDAVDGAEPVEDDLEPAHFEDGSGHATTSARSMTSVVAERCSGGQPVAPVETGPEVRDGGG